MALVNIQNFLAKIYTDGEIRQNFFTDPHGTALQYHLNESEVDEVVQLSKAQIEAFSQSLINKRLLEMKKKFHLTCRVLGPREFYRLFHQFICESTLHAKGGDCDQFVRFMESIVNKEPIEPWIIELLRFEAIRVKVIYSQFFLKIAVFKYDIKEAVLALTRNQDYVEPRYQQRMVVCVKTPLQTTVRFI